ncbi:hypothetical protein ABZ400_17305 [Streptomyces sp. NPDC005897]|uniref:hypothetical protein n=1 Tax=Streptomyces sp. NPDC005897 TaxID=3157081 RepID=UPI0033DE4240
MDILVTVIVLLAVIAAGAFLIHRLNSQHGDRSAAFRYGRGGAVAPDREPTGGQTTHQRVTAVDDVGVRRDRRGGQRGRLRPRRRPRKRPAH